MFPISRHCDAFVLSYLPSPCPNFFVTPNFKLLKKSSSNLRKLKRVAEGGGGIYFIKWQFPAVAQHVLFAGSVPRGGVAPIILRLIEADDVACLRQTRHRCYVGCLRRKQMFLEMLGMEILYLSSTFLMIVFFVGKTTEHSRRHSSSNPFKTNPVSHFIYPTVGKSAIYNV